MAMRGNGRSMKDLVSHLKAEGIIRDTRVEQTMLKVDRANYCPCREPYIDGPVPIGYQATISAPHMHAHALETLKDKLVEGAKVLDVGSGSGYLTACMAHMVGPSGTVYGVEHIGELQRQSELNIRRDNAELLDSGRIKLFQGDGRVGLEKFAPFDVIHVGAAAKEFPQKLVDQLKEGGLMVVPVGLQGRTQTFERVDKLPGGTLKRKELFCVRYVPLTDVESQLQQ